MNQEQNLFPPPLSPTAELDVNDDYLKTLFVGDKYQKYYQEKFNKITPKKTMSGFNIAAFFLGIIWLFYRKMYALGFIMIGVLFLIGWIETYFNINGYGSSIGLAVMFGMLGNSFYKQHVEKQIAKVKAQQVVFIEQELQLRGGTNLWAALFLVGIVVVLILLGIYADALDS